MACTCWQPLPPLSGFGDQVLMLLTGTEKKMMSLFKKYILFSFPKNTDFSVQLKII